MKNILTSSLVVVAALWEDDNNMEDIHYRDNDVEW